MMAKIFDVLSAAFVAFGLAVMMLGAIGMIVLLGIIARSPTTNKEPVCVLYRGATALSQASTPVRDNTKN